MGGDVRTHILPCQGIGDGRLNETDLVAAVIADAFEAMAVKRLLADHVVNNSGITDSWQNQVLQLL